jgi:1-acyl-sn-glycerol-3-phosphate acyltransferase
MPWKYLRLLHAFARAFWIVWIQFPKASREQKLAHIQQWSTDVLYIMSVHVDVETMSDSAPQADPQLLVANHVSWLDVLVIQSLQPCVFVAKSEVRDWPLIGAIAEACGVVFVDRSSSSSAKKMVDEVANALQHGYCVAGFPEGTSSEGRAVSLFHANLFEAAIHHQVQVHPLALRYTDKTTGELCIKAAFVGDISFIASLHQVMCAEVIHVLVHAGKRLSPHGHSRRTLAHLSHRSVVAQLEMLQA